MINWRRSGPSLTSGPQRHSWPDMSEALPVDVLPCSNEEYFPPPPSQGQLAIMRLAEAETERYRRRFRMSRAEFVRTAAAMAIGFWAIDAIRPGIFGNYGGPFGTLQAGNGGITDRIAIADFRYAPGDLSSASATGIPEVKLGTDLRFTNADGAGIYHSITSCKYPCLGQTGAAYPLADGATSIGTQVDFDSSQLGIGTPEIGPAKETLDWDLPITPQKGFKPGETVTYFCRIHPFMRGAFRVTQ